MKPWIPILALGVALSPLAVMHPIRVRGRSMAPTLGDGKVCWVLRSWAAGVPTPYQVWIVDTPDGSSIKRILALPGERLEIRNGDLFRQDVRLEEPYVHYLEHGNEGPWDASSGYLLLGDNRPESRDSRAWGPIPRSAFHGHVLGMD